MKGLGKQQIHSKILSVLSKKVIPNLTSSLNIKKTINLKKLNINKKDKIRNIVSKVSKHILPILTQTKIKQITNGKK